jgi:hypothetical protein
VRIDGERPSIFISEVNLFSFGLMGGTDSEGWRSAFRTDVDHDSEVRSPVPGRDRSSLTAQCRPMLVQPRQFRDQSPLGGKRGVISRRAFLASFSSDRERTQRAARRRAVRRG